MLLEGVSHPWADNWMLGDSFSEESTEVVGEYDGDSQFAIWTLGDSFSE